ncbi:MAG TPA: N-acetylornithine carbamoyltransferase [Elusimicrobiota bacterium]|jgi:N-acetylornithine carbamoyltransferase|nr:N-acetylornithine carbamoyltransferase [Elusimicrobiota bacterium]
MKLRHFTHLHEFSSGEIMGLVDDAIALKKSAPKTAPLAGRSLAFCFMNPSLRTQVSFSVATHQLGGHPVTLSLGSGGTWGMESVEGVVMDGTAAEHLKEAVPVLGRFCAALGLRSFPAGTSWAEDKTEPHLTAFRKYSTVPVINMESATGHPCQALADLMTIRERMNPKNKNFLLTWAPHIKALPMAVPNSAVEIAAMAGMNVTIARPEGYDLDPEVMARVKANCSAHGTTFKTTDKVPEAFDGQHAVYAKSWGSLANYGKPPSADPSFRKKWIVDAAKMKRTHEAIFLHCLPVRRNLVVADDVLDGRWSVVVDQAENRLHAAKAVLLRLLSAAPKPTAASRRHVR